MKVSHRNDRIAFIVGGKEMVKKLMKIVICIAAACSGVAIAGLIALANELGRFCEEITAAWAQRSETASNARTDKSKKGETTWKRSTEQEPR